MENIHPYLWSWIERLSIREGFDEALSDHDKVVEIYRLVLGLTNTSEEDIARTLASFYTLPSPFSVLSNEALELLLFHAVSDHCDCRADCVEEIVVMDEDCQVYLMELIKSYMNRREEFEVSSDNQQDGDVHVELPDATRPFEDPSLAFAAESINIACPQCVSFRDEIDIIKQDLDAQKQKYQKEILELKQKLTAEGHRLEDSEVALFEKDREVFRLQKLVEEYEAKLKEMDKLSSQLSQTKSTLAALQDEIDLIRPQAQRADALEANLSKMREKLEELTEIKQQLKVEVSTHQETYAKLVAAEQELQDLRSLKPQLDQYRSELAEIMITNEDYLQRLNEQSIVLKQFEDERERLNGGTVHQLRQQETLAQELRAASEQLREQARFEGIGEGISELNPALMQELHRLRTDNADLVSRLSKCSTEALAKLEKEIADIKCVNASLQQKWTKTKDSLAAAEKTIVDLQARLWAEEMLVKDLRRQFAETTALAAEELRCYRANFHAKALFLESKAQAQASLIATGLGLVVQQYKSDRDDLSQRLEASEMRGETLSQSLEETTQTLLAREEDVAEACRKRKRLEEEHASSLLQLREEHEEQVRSLQRSHEQSLQSAEQRTQDLVAAEAQRAVALAADLEEEVQKRRRLDRTKKLLETEVQRLKVQINGASGTGGDGSGQVFNGDFALAAKELRSMQEQVDQQQALIASLRQQLASRTQSSVDPAQGDNHPVTRSRSLQSQAMRIGSVGHSMTGDASIASTASQSIQSFIEQTELNDKRVEQLNREKREILSKSLEDSKEKMELQQKVAAAEKECQALRTELRKVRLEKERMERKLIREKGVEVVQEDKENVHCNVSVAL